MLNILLFFFCSSIEICVLLGYFFCSFSKIGIGISKKTESLIENLSDLAPESPLKFINECQYLLLKKYSRYVVSISCGLKTVYSGDITPILPNLFRFIGPTGAEVEIRGL